MSDYTHDELVAAWQALRRISVVASVLEVDRLAEALSKYISKNEEKLELFKNEVLEVPIISESYKKVCLGIVNRVSEALNERSGTAHVIQTSISEREPFNALSFSNSESIFYDVSAVLGAAGIQAHGKLTSKVIKHGGVLTEGSISFEIRDTYNFNPREGELTREAFTVVPGWGVGHLWLTFSIIDALRIKKMAAQFTVVSEWAADYNEIAQTAYSPITY